MVIALVKRGGNGRSFHPGKADGESSTGFALATQAALNLLTL
jgi:hypothetical protein